MLNAECHWLIVWIFLVGWLGSRVSWGWLDSPTEDVSDKEYFGLLGDCESNTPKSMNSLAQILALTLEFTLLPSETATLENSFWGACGCLPGWSIIIVSWVRVGCVGCVPWPLILASDASIAPSANCSGWGTKTLVLRVAEVPVNASCTA